jgi:GT2 family glycosyltransferase
VKQAAARGKRALKLAATNPVEFARRAYLKLPMDPATRHRTSTLIRRLIRKAQGSVAPGVSAAPGVFAPAPAREGFADVFVFAIIDWHFRIQRPQHLSRELARLGHRVFYISNHFIDDAAPGFQPESLDADGRLFQIRLNVRGSPAIYFAPPAAQDSEHLLASVSRMLLDVRPSRSIALVEHPYWWDAAQRLPNSTVVYDCMDHHEGFGGMPEALLEIERSARRGADVLVTTSDWLLDRFRPERPRIELVRNACDFDFFSIRPTDVWRDPAGRRVVGYYGAIAEWFDVDLLDRLASELPDVRFRLVGSDTAGAAEKLSRHANVTFVGERPYGELPFHLYGFDVCLMPFKVIPLTLATNPVKVYEYLAAGRSVVSVDLPELRQFGDLVFTAKDHDEFVAKVKRALAEPSDEQAVARRQEFASRQTWRHRATALADAFRTAEEPRVSVIVLTYNNLPLTQACLKSLAESDYPNLELIVVDNHSTDGSPEWLRKWAEGRPDTRLVLNDTNTGFAGGNNIGLRVATGEYLVILNNDTYVTRGWIRTLLAHFKRDPKLGLLGPVTNNIGNEAKIEIEYGSMEEMATRSQRYTLAHPGNSVRLRTAAFFCVMMRRAVLDDVGELCEEYARGFFEDDDYCRRVERAGWTIECADDVFVHHHLSASFDALGATAKRELFERNKAIYEAKWGAWQSHAYREQRK